MGGVCQIISMNKVLLISLGLALCGCVSRDPPVIYDISSDRVVVAAKSYYTDSEYLEQIHKVAQQGCGVYGHEAVYISRQDSPPDHEYCHTNPNTGYTHCWTTSTGKHHLFACRPLKSE